MKIILDDLTHPKVLALLQSHLDGMHENSPPEHVHGLDVSNLQLPEVSFWTAWEGEDLLGCGAIKELSGETGEIKSMRTHAAHLRKGVAAKILEHILATAKERGYKRLSLETGYGPAFEPALNLYRKYGFQNGDAFAQYEANDFSQFLHLQV
ncbi:MAG: GNAT family N-acetyltransferase [Pseudomonadota bacterium]